MNDKHKMLYHTSDDLSLFLAPWYPKHFSLFLSFFFLSHFFIEWMIDLCLFFRCADRGFKPVSCFYVSTSISSLVSQGGREIHRENQYDLSFTATSTRRLSCQFDCSLTLKGSTPINR